MTKNEFENYLNQQYREIKVDDMPLELINYIPKFAAGHYKFPDMGSRIRRKDKVLFKALLDECRAHERLNDKVNFKLEAIWNPLKKRS